MARHCDHCKPDLCLFAGGGSGGGGGGGGGGPLLVHFTYDEDNDRYPGDATAAQVYASILSYGFATGVYADETANPCIITAYNMNDGYYFKLGWFTGIEFIEFDEFNALVGTETKYLADEYICGYYHGIS